MRRQRSWARAFCVIAGALLATMGAVSLRAAPASAGFEAATCTGYASCNAAGYSDFGYSTSSATSYWGMYPGHNCTNYAAYRLVQRGIDASYLRGHGNANEWGEQARAHGVPVDARPAVGDIAWWDANVDGVGPSGHVSYVESVGPGTTPSYVVVSEDNFSGDFNWRRITLTSNPPSGFIHFGSTAIPTPSPTPSVSAAPGTSPSPGQTSSPTPTPTPTPTAVPSPTPTAASYGKVVLSQRSARGVATLTAVVNDHYIGETVIFFRRSGLSGKVQPLGVATVDDQDIAQRVLTLKPGQTIAAYGKLLSEGMTSPYSNTVSFKVAG